ncbi:MAG: hypothetical protein ACYSWX_02895 [Planctomycetota bacterium]
MSLLLTFAMFMATPQEEAFAAASQDAGRPTFEEPGGGSAGQASASAEGLRQSIRDMRMNLLLGGDRVRTAEREAIEFYGERAGFVDQRLDTVDSDLAELRASYDVAVERALSATSAAQRTKAFREAQPLRGSIESLESERSELVGKRDRLHGLVDSIRARDDDRERLVAQLESSTALPDTLGMPSLGVGLAPPPLPAEPISPLEDTALLQDLFERDPEGARTLVWDLDPIGYWEIFPLQPPTEPLRAVLRFPVFEANSRP